MHRGGRATRHRSWPPATESVPHSDGSRALTICKPSSLTRWHGAQAFETRRLTGNHPLGRQPVFDQPFSEEPRCPFQRSRLKGPLTIRIFSDAAPILLALSLLMRPPQTDSGPSAVTIDKFDSGGLQGTPNGQIVCGRHGCLLKLSALDGAQAHGRLARKVVRRPPKECPGRPDLRIRKWFFFVLTHGTSCVIFYVNRHTSCGSRKHEITDFHKII